MDERGSVLKGLNEIRIERVLEQRGHRAVGLELRGEDGLLRLGAPHDDASETLLQVGEILREAENGHDFRGHGDVKTRLAWVIAVVPETGDDLAESAVIQVHRPPPGDTPRIETERISPVEMIFDHRREKIVRRADGVEVAGEMEIDLIHRDDLGVTSARRATLETEGRS